jgi:hypothetical protein
MNISKYIQMLDLDQIFAHVDTLWFFYVFLLQVQFNCHELDVPTMTRHDHASCLVAECMLNAIQIYSIYIPLNAIKIHQITITSPYYSIYYVANQWYGQFYILPFIKFILYYITIIYISIYTIYTISPYGQCLLYKNGHGHGRTIPGPLNSACDEKFDPRNHMDLGGECRYSNGSSRKQPLDVCRYIYIYYVIYIYIM